jgi:hypothetical protein
MYKSVMNLVLTFQKVTMEFAEDPASLELFISMISAYMHTCPSPITYIRPFQLSTASGAARQEDTSSLKWDILQYMLKDPNKDVLDLPLTTTHSKSCHGFNHPTTAYFLCPADLFAEYETASNIRQVSPIIYAGCDS